MSKIIAITKGNPTYGRSSLNKSVQAVTTASFQKMPRELIGAVLKLIIGAVDSAKSQGDLRLEFRFPKPRIRQIIYV